MGMDYVSAVCCLVAFLLYYNTLDAGFVYDDRRAILGNPDLLPKTPWSRLWADDFWGTPLSDSGSHGSYRPLCVLSFRLNYLLNGFQPRGYHLVNVALHCLATALLVRVARRVLPRARSGSAAGPAITGLLFAAHPIHTEAVAGVVGRADLAACNFYLLSFLAYIAHVQHRDGACCRRCYLLSSAASGATSSSSGPPPTASGSKEDSMRQVKALKYQRFIYSLQRNVTSCHWPHKRLPRDQGCSKYTGNSASLLSALAAGSGGECPAGCWRSGLRQWALLIACAVLALAAMLSKETGITVVGVCVVYDFVSCPSLRKKQWRSMAVLGASALLFLLVRLQTPVPQFSTADNPTARDGRLLTRLLTFLHLPAFNFWLLLLPHTLSFDWGMDAVPKITTLFDGRNLWTAAFYAAMVLATKRCLEVVRRQGSREVKFFVEEKPTRSPCRCSICHSGLSDVHSVSCRTSNNNNSMSPLATCDCPLAAAPGGSPLLLRQRPLGPCGAVLLALALLVLPFLPASNLAFYVGFVVAERVLYISSAGLCLLLGLGGASLCRRLGRRSRVGRNLFLCGMMVVVFAFGARTVVRNRDWNSEEALYRSAIPVNPPKAYGNLGSVLNSQGRTAEAEWAFRKALQFRPNMADVHYNLGILLQARQKVDEAIESYQRAIHFRPSLALAYVNLGAALISAGRCQEAVSILRLGSRLDGTGLKDRREHETARVSALLQLGALYSDQGRLQRALAAYREAAHSLPDHYPPQSVFNVLGETLARLQQDEEAERWYQAALNAQPDHVPAHITYGKLLAKNVSRAAEAEQWFRKAQRLAPEEPSVYHHYASVQFLNPVRDLKIGEKITTIYVIKTAGKYGDFLLLDLPNGKLPLPHRFLTIFTTEFIENFNKSPPSLVYVGSDGRTHLYRFEGEFLASRRRYKEAAGMYERAAELRPKDYELAVAVATAMRQAGRHLDAERWYRKAVALKPTDARSHTNLGAILHLNGKYSEAADSYREALRLQPDDVTTLTNLHKLHSVMT